MIIYERLAEVPGVVRGILKNLTKKYFEKKIFICFTLMLPGPPGVPGFP